MKRIVAALLVVLMFVGVASAQQYDLVWHSTCYVKVYGPEGQLGGFDVVAWFNHGRWIVDLIQVSDTHIRMVHETGTTDFTRQSDGRWQAYPIGIPYTGGCTDESLGFFTPIGDARAGEMVGFDITANRPGSGPDGGASLFGTAVRMHRTVAAAPAPPPPPTPAPAPTSGPTLAIGLSANQVVKGSTPIKITTTGFTGSLRYTILVDDGRIQKWTWLTSATTITQWWKTSAVPNGTHRVQVTVQGPSGTKAADVSVVVRN